MYWCDDSKKSSKVNSVNMKMKYKILV